MLDAECKVRYYAMVPFFSYLAGLMPYNLMMTA